MLFVTRTARKWERAVDYACVHALHAAGFDKPDSFRTAKVSDLLLIPVSAEAYLGQPLMMDRTVQRKSWSFLSVDPGWVKAAFLKDSL